MTQTGPLLAYILSAGYGRRLGGVCKGRVLVNSVPLVVRQIHALRQAGVSQVCVVVGHEANRILEILDQYQELSVSSASGGPVLILHSSQEKSTPREDPDVQVSVRCALSHAKKQLIQHPNISGVLMTLADLPLLTSSDISELVRCSQSRLASAVIPVSSSDQPGHPIWLSREMVLKLYPEQTEFSLRTALRRDFSEGGREIHRMTTTRSGFFDDLDTSEDVAKLRQHYGMEITIPT